MGARHYLYGGAEGTPERLAAALIARFPGATVVGTHSPPFREMSEEELERELARINAAQPDFVWIGLGTPQQDYWVARHRRNLEASVVLAVGAAFDFHAGTLRRAPVWMQRTGLEWAFRLLMEPRRLWRRYLVFNGVFLTLVTQQALTAALTRMRRAALSLLVLMGNSSETSNTASHLQRLRRRGRAHGE